MKIGDIVRLKSGGPQMTVSEIVRKPNIQALDIVTQYKIDNLPEYVTCKWWNVDKFESENFGIDAVEVIG